MVHVAFKVFIPHVTTNRLQELAGRTVATSVLGP
jgi:hypothetical protein